MAWWRRKVADDAPVQTSAYLGAHLSEANRLFAPNDVGFEVDRIEAEPVSQIDMGDREDRRMTRHCDRMFADGSLVDRARPP